MNLFAPLIILSTWCPACTLAQDTVKNTPHNIIVHVERMPEYPGGMSSFTSYISKSLKYPEVAQLIGLEGKVYVSFVVDRDGKVIQATPTKCIGAGCESEAVRVVSESKSWKPGFQDGKPVKVQFTIPINFTFTNGKTKVKIKDLRNSKYGFIIRRDNKIYSLDEAETAFGKALESKDIVSAEQCFDPALAIPDKQEVYMIIMRS